VKKNKLRIQLLGLVFLLSSNVSCITLGYYNRLAQHQAYILRAKTPIDRVLNDPMVSSEIKEKLTLVLEVRDFATKELGLKVGSNYLDYVALKEESVSFVVNAAEKYDLISYQWSYPIVGKLPYRGYPTKTEAEEEAKRMEKRGYDVFVRGVNAYSTLGWFDDPIFSSMLSLPSEKLVETIIHESVHATIFYKDDADFNERLATFLGGEGAKLFYLSRKQPETAKKIDDDKVKQFAFSKVMAEETTKLRAWYKDSLSQVKEEGEKERLKAEKLSELKNKLMAMKYATAASQLNNARLMLISTYNGDDEGFQKLYSKFSSFKELIERLKTLKHSKDLQSL
jgi:predicted aminopeptidase